MIQNSWFREFMVLYLKMRETGQSKLLWVGGLHRKPPCNMNRIWGPDRLITHRDKDKNTSHDDHHYRHHLNCHHHNNSDSDGRKNVLKKLKLSSCTTKIAVI